MNVTLVLLVIGVILLYVLIKAHIYATRKVWSPVFEEEIEDHDDP